MNIYIDDSKKIADIQEAFTQEFPFLKLVFYHAEVPLITVTKNTSASSGDMVGHFRQTHQKGHIIIDPGMPVSGLEDIFKTYYGLSVQVLRQLGSVWVNTGHTYNWSLKEQNEQGEKVSKHFHEQQQKRKSNPDISI